MSSPKHFEVLQARINPATAKRNTGEVFRALADAHEAGLLSVQNMRIEWHVTRGLDTLRVEFNAGCCDGPVRE
jgi:hypothetical protein